MRALVAVAAAVALSLLPVSISADDFPTALRQLHALQSVVGAGVTFPEYHRRVLDAKIVIDRYAAKGDPNTTRRNAVVNAADVHIAATTAWRTAISGEGSGLGMGIGHCPPALTALTVAIEAIKQRPRLGERPMQEVYSVALPVFWLCTSAWIAHAEGGPTPAWEEMSARLRGDK